MLTFFSSNDMQNIVNDKYAKDWLKYLGNHLLFILISGIAMVVFTAVFNTYHMSTAYILAAVIVFCRLRLKKNETKSFLFAVLDGSIKEFSSATETIKAIKNSEFLYGDEVLNILDKRTIKYKRLWDL